MRPAGTGRDGSERREVDDRHRDRRPGLQENHSPDQETGSLAIVGCQDPQGREHRATRGERDDIELKKLNLFSTGRPSRCREGMVDPSPLVAATNRAKFHLNDILGPALRTLHRPSPEGCIAFPPMVSCEMGALSIIDVTQMVILPSGGQVRPNTQKSILAATSWEVRGPPLEWREWKWITNS